MRRALKARDQGCRFRACTHKHYIDGHHIEHWSRGGETSLANLVQLCRRHWISRNACAIVTKTCSSMPILVSLIMTAVPWTGIWRWGLCFSRCATVGCALNYSFSYREEPCIGERWRARRK
ncbi:MAG: HNH endonuclease [Gammaproteobacteria bacterium]|nr:HNH endonuclease [Gammaproteobacteria bacterium]